MLNLQRETLKTGFTLIELVMVMVIISVLAFVAAAQMVSMEPIRQDMAARKIQSDIRYAQSLASSIQKRTRIDFSAAADTYSLYIEDTPGSWVLTEDPMRKEDFTVRLNSGEFQGVDIAQVFFNAADRSLAFDQWGNPYSYDIGSDTATDLNNPARVTVSGPTQIFVERGTGRVYIQ